MFSSPPPQTRMQVVNPTPAAIYTGLGNAIATISRVEGYMGLWRGLSSVVVGAGEKNWSDKMPSGGGLTVPLQAPHTPSILLPTRW